MNTVTLALLSAVVGVDVGWQPLKDGGFEYIVQIEPQLLDTLKSGNDLVSDLPPELWGVRTYRITVGNGRLPRVGAQPQSAEHKPAAPHAAPPQAEPRTAAPAAEPAAPPETARAAAGLKPDAPGEFSPPESARELGAAEPAGGAVASESPVEPAKAAQYQLAVVTAELPPAPRLAPELGPVAQSVEPQATAAKDTAAAGTPQQSWGLLTLATVGLFLSLGFNAFLGWVTWGFRQRYTSLLDELDDPQPAPA